MQMTKDDRPFGVRLLAPAVALLLLSILAVPAAAQRAGHGGRGGSGHGHYGGDSGHRSVGHGYGHRGHGYRSYGYRNIGRGHQGHYGYGYRGYGYSDRGYGNRGYGYGHRGYGYGEYRGSSKRYGSSRYDYGYRYRGRAHYGYGGYSARSYVYGGPQGYLGCSSYGPARYSRAYDVSPAYGRSRPHAPHGPRFRNYQSRWAGYAIESPVSSESYDSQTSTGYEPYDSQEPMALISLAIEPGDASVYLDGYFLGLASELPEELQVTAGSHQLEIGRPGFASQQLEIETQAGESLDVSARLEPETARR